MSNNTMLNHITGLIVFILTVIFDVHLHPDGLHPVNTDIGRPYNQQQLNQ